MDARPKQRNWLPKETPVRYVSVLFPEVSIQATPEQIEFYRQCMPYAFVIDRQSNHKELKRAGATGQIRRVEAIMSAASDVLKVYLPPAVLKERPEDGELPYEMDPRFYFVDGERKNATGFAANPNARPQLWRGYELAHALSDAGVGPSYFIIGEATRFFRNPAWLERFVRSLWSCKPPVQFYCCGFGPVTENTLPGLLAYVQATSQHLPKVKEGYRHACRIQHHIPHNQPPFGLRFTGPGGRNDSEIRAEVWTEPDQWHVLTELVHGLADGTLASSQQIAVWLKQTHGIDRSLYWILDILKDPVLDGVYVCDDKAYTSRVLRQQDRLFDDLDITTGGYRRHLITPRNGLEFPVQYTPGTQPIPPDVLQLARKRVKNRRGHPCSTEAYRGLTSIIPGRLLRCAVCGYNVKQQAAGPKGNPHWKLQCWGAYDIKRKEKVTLEEAESRCPHLRRVAVDLSPYVWDTFLRGILENPVPPCDETPDAAAEEIAARKALTVANEAWLNFQQRAENGELGDQRIPDVRDYIQGRRTALLTDLAEAREQLNFVEQRVLSHQRTLVTERAVSETVCAHTEEFDDAKKRALLEEIVDRIDVHLEERWFLIHCDAHTDALRRLKGGFPSQASINQDGRRTTFNFQTIFKGRFAA